MADVFVSYVREDRDIAEKLASGLNAAGFSVWWDRHIRGGAEFAKEIERELDAARAVIVLWSGDSLSSPWVRDEAEQAREEDKLIPVRLDGVQPPLGFRQTQALDFTGWKGDAKAATFAGLVESVQHFIGGAASSSLGVAMPSTKSPDGRLAASRRRWLVASIAAVAVVAGAAALLFLGPRVPLRTATANDGSIEMSAFEPLTKSDELERFAKTIAATMVRVFAMSGVKTITPGQVDGAAEGSNSGAEFALHGRVDREGDDLVVGVDLVNRREALVLWSITQKRNAAQPSVLQEQFSDVVAGALRCAFDGRARALNGDRSTDMFAQYLRLCEAFATAIEQTPELARRLVETAPQYAGSYWAQALANAMVSVTPTLRGDRPPAEIARLRKVVYDSARIAADMDPRFDPLLARAIVVDPAVGLAVREKYLQQSVEREGLESFSFGMEATLLEIVGRIREAHIVFGRAVSANPIDPTPRLEAAFLAAWLGNIEIARHEFDEMRKRTPDFGVDIYQLWTEMWFGDGAIAKAIHERIKEQGAREWSGPECMAYMANARAANARPSSEEELRRECDAWPVFAYFGYVDAAFRELEEDATRHPIDSIHYWPPYLELFMPHMRNVRADPRFMPLAARIGLVDYWLDTDQWPDFCTTEKLPYDCKTAALAARTENERRGPAPANPG
ncbi:MAG TPA: toll/interleukin-1 receptor domain-containing protein [Burkholderiaceae bacterium]|nr:toll/interleukin-1 receptor domain-containing protein [Burkholderiaceae bacterium]